MIFIFIIFIISTLLSALAVSLILFISHKRGWYDRIDDRKIHDGSIPRLGGIGFASVFLIITGFIAAVYIYKGANLMRYAPCAIAIVIILAAGILDDFHPIRPLFKLLLQIFTALCVIISGFDFDMVLYEGTGILTNLGFLKYPITLLWIVGLTNAINLIDGVDGLAGGVSAIIALFLGLVFYSYAGVSKSVLICICLFGAIIGFLIFNAPLPKAKIFMGDGGSQFLGFTLAILPLMKEMDTHSSLPLLYAAALFTIPILDTTAAVWRRIRDGKKISEPDKYHIHHKLMNFGLEVKGVIGIILSVQIIIGVLTFISVRLNGIFSILLLSAAYLIAIIFFVIIHYLHRRYLRKLSTSS